MARIDRYGEPFANPINPLTKRPIYGDPVSLITAGASIVGGLLSSGSASDAAQTQSDAANQATASQERMFKLVNDQQTPFRQAGNTALNALLYGTGLTDGTNNSSNQTFGTNAPLSYDAWAAMHPNNGLVQNSPELSTYARLIQGANSNGTAKGPTQEGYQQYLNSLPQNTNVNQTSAGAVNPSNVPNLGSGSLTHQFNADDLKTNLAPSYNFMLNQGIGALQNSAAAKGGLISGNSLRDINNYAQDYASTGYQQAYNNFNQNQNNIFSRLSQIAGYGPAANTSIAQAASSFSPGIASTIQGAGQARASGIVGSSNAISGALNNAAGWYAYSHPQTDVNGNPYGTTYPQVN